MGWGLRWPSHGTCWRWRLDWVNSWCPIVAIRLPIGVKTILTRQERLSLGVLLLKDKKIQGLLLADNVFNVKRRRSW